MTRVALCTAGKARRRCLTLIYSKAADLIDGVVLNMRRWPRAPRKYGEVLVTNVCLAARSVWEVPAASEDADQLAHSEILAQCFDTRGGGRPQVKARRGCGKAWRHAKALGQVKAATFRMTSKTVWADVRGGCAPQVW